MTMAEPRSNLIDLTPHQFALLSNIHSLRRNWYIPSVETNDADVLDAMEAEGFITRSNGDVIITTYADDLLYGDYQLTINGMEI